MGNSVGIGFPFTISAEHGRVMESSGRANIKESVRIILSTEPGERTMRPEFGTRLHQFMFEIMDSRIEEMIRREIIHSLSKWEERIEDIAVVIDQERISEGILYMDISYRVIESGEEDRVSVRLEQ